ncbi:hypothetical protein, conserved [Plasmodium gonderi]|uniref:Cell division control protein 73 C-terminal domain-containing protein n=1 Tax=Plasmodium gonderi TaxID=77519 RepID=A0A1Y1JGH5_PLAGO|nr:hypothetical protein, conserved [Plasmodium gonderi]GAW81350.1 hypothetical protein, conserved [Plasmodium gonderi]
MGSDQLNLKILMKKFLSEEKEYIKFMNKDERDIILFEKENFYIYANILCGIESRKKEKYNIGDIYLFLCLPKSNYTFSYINSIGYKYISILEKSKIIKIIEDNEDSDEIKVNFFVYDLKKILDLHDYVDLEEKDQGIQADLFDFDNVYDVDRNSENESRNEKGSIKKSSTKSTTQDGEEKAEGEVFNSSHRKRKRGGEDGTIEQLGAHIKPSDYKKNPIDLIVEEKFISFDNLRSICNTEKVDNSIILYVSNDYYSGRVMHNQINPQEMSGKHNFLQNDISTQEYDSLIYFNCNEVNDTEEIVNDASNNYDFIKMNFFDLANEGDLTRSSYHLESSNTCVQVPTILEKDEIQNSVDRKNKTIITQSDEKYEKDKKHLCNNDPCGNSLQKMLKHYYDNNNFFQSIFLQNMNLYSVMKNTYLTSLENENHIDQCVKFIIHKFHRDYVKYMESDKNMVLSTCNDFLKRYSKHNYTDIYHKGDLYKNFADYDMLDLDMSINDYNEEKKHPINIVNDKSTFIDHNDSSSLSTKRENTKFLVGQYIPLDIVQTFNDHDKIIFFHDLLAQYAQAIYDKNNYNKNRAVINFVHNFVKNFSLEESLYWEIDPKGRCILPPEELLLSDQDDIFCDVGQEEVNLEKENTNDVYIIPTCVNEETRSKDYTHKCTNVDNNCIVIRGKLNRKTISNINLSKEQIEGNEELVKSIQVKEVNVQDSYDMIGKSPNDFSRIYNFFERELLNKSSIKNVCINGIKKNIIIDDNIKPRIGNVSLKLIDEIHLTYKKRPIILIEKESNNHIINKSNIESFFLHNNLDNSNMNPNYSNTVSVGGPYDSISIIYKMFNKKKSIKFSFIENDKISKLTETDWKCVIAVIIKSKESLKGILDEYPFEIPTALFHPFKSFFFMYNDVTIPSDLLTGGNIDIIRLNRKNRKEDYIAVNKFWTNIEKFILQRRDKSFYTKKKQF